MFGQFFCGRGWKALLTTYPPPWPRCGRCQEAAAVNGVDRKIQRIIITGAHQSSEKQFKPVRSGWMLGEAQCDAKEKSHHSDSGQSALLFCSLSLLLFLSD